MAITRSYPATLELTELQQLTSPDESVFGPIDGMELGSDPVSSSITFDDSITLVEAVSVIGAAEMFPDDRLAYVRGQLMAGGVAQAFTAYTKRDEALLVARCISYFTSFGWSQNQAVGIIASIKFESDFNPAASGDLDLPLHAYGLCQWRGTRQTDFHDLHGLPLEGSTFREQLEFIHWELGHTEHVAGSLLRGTTNIADAATTVCQFYERPKHPDIDSVTRVSYATQIASKFV